MQTLKRAKTRMAEGTAKLKAAAHKKDKGAEERPKEKPKSKPEGENSVGNDTNHKDAGGKAKPEKQDKEGEPHEPEKAASDDEEDAKYLRRAMTVKDVKGVDYSATMTKQTFKKKSRRSISARLHYAGPLLKKSAAVSEPAQVRRDELSPGRGDGGEIILDISGRQLGELPDKIVDGMTNLQILNCAQNEISRLPPKISNLTELSVLSASDNRLTALPKSIGQLKKLKLIDLHNNLLYKLPKSLRKLDATPKLLLQGNRFAAFPRPVCHMAALQKLSLSHNRMLSLPPQIARLANLEILELDHNLLRNVPRELWAMRSLKQLKLDHNQLSGIPADLSALSELTSFHVGSNAFSEFPEGCLTLPVLEELSIEGSNITAIPPKIKDIAGTVKTLVLSKNQLIDLPEEFRSLLKLESLDLRGNPMGGLGFRQGKWKVILVDLTALKDLKISSDITEDAIKEKKKKEESAAAAAASSPSSSSASSDGGADGNPDGYVDQVFNLGSVKGKTRLKGVRGMAGGGGGNTFDMFRSMSSGDDLAGRLREAQKERDNEALINKMSNSNSNNRLNETRDKKNEATANHTTKTKDSENKAKRRSDGSVENHKDETEKGDGEEGKEVVVEEEEDNEKDKEGQGKEGDESAAIREYWAVDDMNKAGIQKANKVLQQEDAHCEHFPLAENNERALFCVFDGHGGKEAARMATAVVPEEFIAHLKQFHPHDDASELLHVALLNADERLRAFEYEGCTATVVFIWKHGNRRYLQCANLGDSSAFLSDGSKVVPLTKAHKLQEEEERERMKKEGIQLEEGQTRIKGGLGLTRALGDHFAKDNQSGLIAIPHLGEPIRLAEHNTHLIIASDGLWDVMSGKVALDLAKKQATAKEAAQQLLKLALKNKECKDNVAITVVRL